MQIDRWEYRFIGELRGEGLLDVFNRLGRDGWEYCDSVVTAGSDGKSWPVTYVFKRRKDPQ